MRFRGLHGCTFLLQTVQILPELFPARHVVLVAGQVLTLGSGWLGCSVHSSTKRTHRATLILVVHLVHVGVIFRVFRLQADAALAALSEAVRDALHGNDFCLATANLVSLKRVVQRHARSI